MTTWYCVTSSWDDRGRGTAAITSRMEAENRPQSTLTETKRKDIWNDWYGSYSEAMEAVNIVRGESII